MAKRMMKTQIAMPLTQSRDHSFRSKTGYQTEHLLGRLLVISSRFSPDT